MKGLAEISTALQAADRLEYRQQIPELLRLRDKLTAHIAETALHLEDIGAVRQDRFRNVGNWVAKHGDISQTQACRMVAGGRLARKHTAIDDAVHDGVLSTDHLAQLTRLVPDDATPFREATFERDHELFIEFAQTLSFPKFSKTCDAWRMLCDDMDPDTQAPQEKDLGISFIDNKDGTTTIRGLILTTDATLLKNALNELADKLLRHEHQTNTPVNDTAGGGRSDAGTSHNGTSEGLSDDFATRVQQGPPPSTDAFIAQHETVGGYIKGRGRRYRKAIALGMLASLANKAPTDGKTPEPLVVVMIDHETFTTEAERFAAKGPPPDPGTVFRDTYQSETFQGQPVTPTQAFEMALKHRIARCVIGAPSRKVDLGRSQRLFKGASRAAVLYRDRTCTEPGCDAPARWLDVDHIIDWQHGGRTDTNNGQGKCRYHHRLEQDPHQPNPDHIESDQPKAA